MNEVIVGEFEYSVTTEYRFSIIESESPKGNKRYEWIEETTDAESDGWFDTYEEAKEDMLGYASSYCGVEA